ncbi:amidase [Pseudogracilibacillus sp. SE30717A]|uniref:amidase n=1 Tax=Pseudogracilibacillus sp. SE30717A TaxID=3098293 RepID=UPI00300DBF25
MSKVINLKVKNNLINLDATEIAELIKAKQVTSEEVTSILIDHIQKVNPALNAVIEDRFSEAKKEAKQKDKEIDSVNWDLQPLYGVPLSIKESLHVKGMKTTGGIVHRKDLIMSTDSDVVHKLKRAGAIILCKTNTPSLCFCHETDNKLYGRTNNAWNKKRTAGGSSGGEAALIGVGGTPVGMSSDIGGSIRFPSHFNGVVGFKPGKFQVSSEGHFPPDNIPLKTRMSSIGPIGKTVRDVQLVYEIIKEKKEKKAFYEKMQIEILPNDNGFPLSKQTALFMDKISEYLKDFYQTNISIPPYFNDSATIWQEIMSIDGGKEIRDLAFNSDRPNIWKSYMQEKMTKKTPVHLYLSWALLGANLFKPSKKRKKEIEAFIEEGDRALNSYLKNRLLIFPVYHCSALKHGDLFKEIFSIKKTYTEYMPYIAYANVWGLPSLTIPIGFDEKHLPIGIQIMSRNENEHAIFKLGKLLESKFGGYIRSTIYD